MSCVPIRHRLPCEVPEGASLQLTTTVRDLALVGIPAADLDMLVLTLFDEQTGEILNGRDHQDILGTNGGDINAAGGLVLTLDGADNPIVAGARASELHVALIEWTWTVDAVTYDGKAEIAFIVRNLSKVPEAT